MTTDWERPIFRSLPQDGYQNVPTVDHLTEWVDARLSDKARQLQDLWKDLCDPLTCKPEYLDYLAVLVGLSGAFWDTQWSASVKRQLIANSHSVLWSLKGTTAVLSYVLNVHQVEHSIWSDGDLVMPFSMSRPFGSAKLRFYLRLPLAYRRESKQFVEAKRTLRNYAPAIVQHKAVYEYFHLGFSTIGEPLFKTN